MGEACVSCSTSNFSTIALSMQFAQVVVIHLDLRHSGIN